MRNHSLDVLKCIMAFCVVIIHAHCSYTDFLSPLTVCAVPVFFTISGYCINGNDINEKLKRALKRTFIIFIWSSILYAFFYFYKQLKTTGNIGLEKEQLFDFFIFNQHPFIYHLWYVNAYIYVLTIMIFLTKLKRWEWTYYLIPILLLYNIILGTYSKIVFNESFGQKFLMPFFCNGLPFFLIGMWLKNNVERFKYLNATLFTFVLLLALFVEKAILPKESTGNMTFISVFFVVFCVVLAVKNPSGDGILAKIGKNDSLNIYIFHPLVIDICGSLITRSTHQFEQIWTCVSPFIVFIVTMILSILYRQMKRNK